MSGIQAHWVCRALNQMLAADPEAINGLVLNRVACNHSLADMPTTYVLADRDGNFSIGLLGVLNGLLGVDPDGWGPIQAVMEDNGTVSKFILAGDVT